MAGLFGYGREAVRVKAKKCEGSDTPEFRKFSVDPQITSYDVLRSILAKAFDLHSSRDFALSYRVLDDFGQETFLSLLSDWDLDAAFLSASEPCLYLQVDVTVEQNTRSNQVASDEDWEVPVAPVAAPMSSRAILPLSLRLPLLQGARLNLKNAGFKPPAGTNFQGILKNQMERTLGLVQRALQVKAEDMNDQCDPEPPDPPAVGDAEFRSYLDPLGTLEHNDKMRDSVFHSGVDPALRKVVWKHLLNVYPEGLSGKERIEYMKRKSHEYQELRDYWQTTFQDGHLVCQEVAAVSSMVRKDVLRTDRHLNFYAGNDDNKNIASLFNVLTTYALNHPSVSYCQGMSDLASPLLVAMQDEPSAYVCFCALMRRLQANFSLDGVAMGLKFQHLSTALLYYDPEFHRYLQNQQASDLLFCYRWLLLELKREFAFEDALRMLEVLWASLPADYPPEELSLYQSPAPFKAVLTSGQACALVNPLGTPRPTAYTRMCAMRRRDARRLSTNKSLDERQLSQQQASKDTKEGIRYHRRPFLSFDDSDLSPQNDSPSMDKAISPRVVRNLNEFRNFSSKQQTNGPTSPSKSTSNDESDSNKFTHSKLPIRSPQKVQSDSPKKLPNFRTSTPKSPNKEYSSDDIFVWENPLQPSPPPSSPVKFATNMTSSCEEAMEASRNSSISPDRNLKPSGEVVQPWYLEQQEVLYSQPLQVIRLPAPGEFGGGNPFLILLCVTLLRQHRDLIMQAHMDYNEMAMHLDHMVRKHNVRRVLREARALYRDYLAQFGNKSQGLLRNQSS